jgi:glucose/arabinose dehydrogenase
VELEIVEAYPLSFEKPLYFAVAGDGSGDCYVVEQTGKIRVFEDSPDAANAPVFLDLSGIIGSGANEKGLLGLAFHPGYAQNGYFYVNYTDKRNTVIARYTRKSAKEADPESAEVLLTFPQPYDNHNGGQLAFGLDGCLYIGTGDGGSSGDPHNNAQNPSSLLGKILRIDVDNPSADMPYGIPVDNPYFGNEEGYREEIYALGLRNPWRFSFDEAGALWVADVGQNAREEIDIVENGGNYGWNVMEGTRDYKDNPDVDMAALIPPIWEYAHGDHNDCITGGYVYSSDAIPDLMGRYIYGDFESGRIWCLWIDGGGEVHNQELLDTDLLISSFGIDEHGDIRIVDLNGKVYRLMVSGA